MIRALNSDELRIAVGSAVGLTSDLTPHSIVRASLRRAAFHLAPASRSNLARFVSEAVVPLGIEYDVVDEAIDDLIVYGDLLEMPRRQDDPWDAPPAVIRPAPPSFVERDSGTFVILGVAGAMSSALMPELAERVDTTGSVRTISAGQGELLADRLKALGLTSLNEGAWLRAPMVETATAFIDRWADALSSLTATPGGVSNLEILDPSRRVRFYRGRWTTPDAKTQGLRLVRRQQDFGAPLWAIAEFHHGLAAKVLELFEDADRQSPRDIGWRFQAAVDAMLGNPQEIRIRREGEQSILDFFSPLPAFAERRLALAGTKTTGQGRLFSFEMTDQAAAVEVAKLQEALWMSPLREGNET
jgi:hypothetical protein